MTQPPNQPYNSNQPYNQGQGYNPNQPYDPNQGQGYDPNQGQSYNPNQGQSYNPNQPYDPNQAQQYAAQQQYMEQHGTPKKRFGARKIISIVVAVAVLGAGGWTLWQHFKTNENLQVGNCLVITGTTTNAQEEKVDCSDKSKFSFEVSQVVSDTSSCPENTASYEISSKSRYGGSSKTVKAVCLIPNLHQDVCYNTSSSGIKPFEVAQCDSASVKVTKRIDQENASCGTDEETLTYTTPARTYCFGGTR